MSDGRPEPGDVLIVEPGELIVGGAGLVGAPPASPSSGEAMEVFNNQYKT